MDFNLTKEQRDMKKTVIDFAEKEFPDLGIMKKACGLGFVGVFINEEYGGAGYGI